MEKSGSPKKEQNFINISTVFCLTKYSRYEPLLKVIANSPDGIEQALSCLFSDRGHDQEAPRFLVEILDSVFAVLDR